MYSGRNGLSFFRLCSLASAMPGAEIEPVTKLTPTGSKAAGGKALAA